MNTLIEITAPEFDAVSILADELHLSVTNRTIDATHTLERSFNPTDTNGWHSVTSFLSTATHTNFHYPITNASPRAAHRLHLIIP